MHQILAINWIDCFYLWSKRYERWIKTIKARATQSRCPTYQIEWIIIIELNILNGYGDKTNNDN